MVRQPHTGYTKLKGGLMRPQLAGWLRTSEPFSILTKKWAKGEIILCKACGKRSFIKKQK